MVIIFRTFCHRGAMLEAGKFSFLFLASNLLLVASDHAGKKVYLQCELVVIVKLEQMINIDL